MPDEIATLLETKRFQVVQVREVRGGEIQERTVIRHPGAVVLLPLLPDGRVCLIRNYRVSVGQTLIELPAGTMEPPEDPDVTARRELKEETGYEAEQIELLTTYFPSPGILDERMRLYLATGLTAGDTAREAGEEIENMVVTWEEALDLIYTQQIQDAKTIAGLLFYDGWKQRQALGSVK